MTDEHKISEPRVSENRDTVTIRTELFHALLQAAGREINPETAEVEWCYGEISDPYGVHDVPKEYQCSCRNYFARAPDTNLWIEFDDLPEATQDALWKKHSSKLAFPAGLFDVPDFDFVIDGDQSHDDRLRLFLFPRRRCRCPHLEGRQSLDQAARRRRAA